MEMTANYWNDIFSHPDPVTENWIMMGSIFYPIGIIFMYVVLAVWVGPYIMRISDETYEIIPIVGVYNLVIFSVNFLMASLFTLQHVLLGYSLLCQPVRTNKNDSNMIAWLMLVFHLSKLLELFDTVILVIKRKTGNSTFVHIFHHASMVLVTWIGVKYVPGGSASLVASLNTWTQVLTYLSFRVGPKESESRLSYKKIVDCLLILQFVITIVHCFFGMLTQCGFPQWIFHSLIVYMLMLMVLYIQLFLDSFHSANGGDGSPPGGSITPTSSGDGSQSVTANSENDTNVSSRHDSNNNNNDQAIPLPFPSTDDANTTKMNSQ